MEDRAGKDPDLGSCLNLLGKLEEEERERFVHRAINDMCEKNGLKYDDYFKLLPLTDFSQLKLALAHAIKVMSREQADKEQLAKKAQAMGANQEVSQVVATCLWVRKEEIHAQLVKDSCNITQSKLEDFDWKLKLIMSSSQLGSIQQPVVSLDLIITENGQKRTENLEMSRDELSRLIISLEAANKVMTQLRT